MKSRALNSVKVTALSTLMALPLANAFAAEKQLEKFYMDYFNYEEYVYSDSQKTEIGDQVELDISMGYNFSESTFLKLGFETYPEENRFDNKTSKFEIEAGHKYKKFEFAVDGELQTDDSSSGGTNIGLDLDSEDTFIAYSVTPKLKVSFHPFNFDGEVGEEFNTWDVTRIYFIDGSPSTIASSQSGDEKIAEKTIPGLVLTYKDNGFTTYAGFGTATYLYPTNGDFDITSNASADKWEKREAKGYKLGLKYKVDGLMKTKLEYVSHDKAEETGSLLESAASFHSVFKLSNLLLEVEATYSKAGKAPWRVSRSSDWFSVTSPFQPIYSDNLSAKQNWIGEADMAYALKVGMDLNDEVTPFAFVRYQGEHFVFRERESAHMLRTGDESQSHGGLTRLGIGTYIYQGNFTIKPEFEYLKAKNPVFSNSSDVRSDRVLSQFKKKDYQLSLEVSFDYDGYKEFAL